MEAELDLLITGGCLLSMSQRLGVIDDPLIGIRDGRIVSVGPSTGEPPAAREVLDASGCLVLPGLINTHTHLPMVCFRGLADDLELMEWLEGHIFPAEARHMSPETVSAGSRLAMAEMILSGTTTFCDGYFFEDSTARAALETGMRAVVCQGIVDFPTPDAPDPSRNLELAEDFLKTWKGASDLITPALFCHAPYTCGPQTYRAVKDLAREQGVFLHTHVAETRTEVMTITQRYATTPIRHLHNLGVLDGQTVAVHCVWVDEEEIELLAASGTKVSHNPQSNMKLASGIAPIPRMLEQGITVGLGTDGCASNNDLDLLDEMDTAAKLHKVANLDPTLMDAATVLAMATTGGARTLGLEGVVGAIEPGMAADLILLDLSSPHLTPLYHPISHTVYAASGADVKTSVIAGRIVMRDRHLLTLDVEEAMQQVRSVATRIRG